MDKMTYPQPRMLQALINTQPFSKRIQFFLRF